MAVLRPAEVMRGRLPKVPRQMLRRFPVVRSEWCPHSGQRRHVEAQQDLLSAS